MERLYNIFDLAGRILLASIFFISGVRKIFHFHDTVDILESKGITHWTNVQLTLGIFLLLFSSILLLIGYRVKLAALLLSIFLITVTIIFHFDFNDPTQLIHFMKNVALLGALFNLIAHGSGAYSVRRLLASTRT